MIWTPSFGDPDLFSAEKPAGMPASKNEIITTVTVEKHRIIT
jgi:hypothetical protein